MRILKVLNDPQLSVAVTRHIDLLLRAQGSYEYAAAVLCQPFSFQDVG